MIELNEYGGKIGYKNYPFRHMQHLMRLNDFMVAGDLKRYYHIFKLHHESRNLGLIWIGNSTWATTKFGRKAGTSIILRCTRMFFGLRDAPRVAEKFLRLVDEHLRRSGIRMVRIMDDLAILASTFISTSQLATIKAHHLNGIAILKVN